MVRGGGGHSYIKRMEGACGTFEGLKNFSFGSSEAPGPEGVHAALNGSQQVPFKVHI